MVDNNKQQEVFIINDIEMEINPSDIQVMDDNWVMEDSYLRSKAVFCYRSKYSATKVVLNIPFQISYLTEEDKVSLNNTYNCIKLVSELNAYPFCFIKNNRIKAYISPSTMSVTDYMLFAVDEIAIVQDSKASNMVFLEVVLQYFNHVPLIKDFEFRSNLSVALGKKGIQEDIAATVVNSLRDSEVWKKYMNPRVKKVLENLTESGLLDYTDTNNKSIHPIMGVNIKAPIMSVIGEGIENVDDGRYIGKDSKVITVTDISRYDEGTFENLLATLTQQDFSFDSPEYRQTETVQTINSENRIKQGEIVTSKEKAKAKEEDNLKKLNLATKDVNNIEVVNPFLKVAEEYEQLVSQSNKNKENAVRNLENTSKDVFIDWVGTDIQALSLGIQKIEIRRKNRLVSHQIGAYKHPVVQYMGKYPVSMNISIASTNFEIYQMDEPPPNVFIKQVLNILDYNRAAIPEAEAYNYIKINSLASFLLDCEAFLPSQSVVSASSNSQGLEQIVYSFNEGDLTAFIEQGKVEASGKPEIDKSQAVMIDIIIKWLKGMPQSLNNIVNNSKADSNITNTHILTIYKSIIELTNEAMKEMTMQGYPQYAAITTALDYSGDLKPNNNVIRKYKRIDTTYTKELANYKVYEKFINNNRVNVATENVLDSKYSGNASNIAYIKKAEQQREKIKEEGVSLTILQLHNALIPFMAFILKTRSLLMSGKSTNLPSISFTPSGRFNNLALSILSKIDTGIKEGAIVNEKELNNQETKDYLNKLTKQYAKVFFGYNIEDLDYEILSSGTYNKTTDLLVPKIDPFFFIKEITVLDGNEFEAIYERMYKDSNYNQNLLDYLNEDSKDEEEPDATAQRLGVTYRKLQEIDYQPIDTKIPEGMISAMGNWGAMMAGVDLSGSSANAKKVDDKIVQAIEKALKKYGKDKDQGFRKYMYAVLLKESANGTKLRSDTGAVGLFQFTSRAVKDLIQYKKNTLQYSNGNSVGYAAEPSISVVRSVKAASSTDHYLNAQMFIEKTLKEKGAHTSKNGVSDPTYSFIQHNIGRGGLDAVKAVIENGATSIPSNIRELIRTQNKAFIGSNDVQTVRNYYRHMAEKMAIDNVPDYVNIDAKSTVKSAAKDIVNGVSSKTASAFIPFTSETLAKKGDQAFIPFAKQQKAIEQANQVYKAATVSLKDKTSNTTISAQTITGTVTKVLDGDTVVIKDSKTNKNYNIRLYGLDAPEVAHIQDEGKKKSAEVHGENSKKALTGLVLGKKVSAQIGGKTYGRDVGLVKLADGTDISLTMLRNGNGFVAEGFTNAGEYAFAQEEAKKNQKGLWSYPDGVVTKPRSKTGSYIGNKSEAELANIKNNINYESFKETDLAYAKQVNKNALNRFVPLAQGTPYRISAPYGEKRDNRYGMHTGIDFASNPPGSKNILGCGVIAAASGTAYVLSNPSGYGNYVKIDHGNGFTTIYGHLSKVTVQDKSRVNANQKIGEVGNTGRSSGPHLHYEVRYNNQHINPFGTKELTLYKPGDPVGQMGVVTSRTLTDEIPELEMTRKGVTKENTVYNEDELASAIFRNIYKNTNVGLKTALPAIKIYMTVGNENDNFWLDTLKGDILYYELKGVKSFRMNCNNDGNPTDTAIISVADPSFLNTDGFVGISKMQGVNIDGIGTSLEMQFKNNRIQLKPGNKIHVRLGYGNNPNDLDIVFNGSIADVEMGNQCLNLVCKGFGEELLNEILATDKPVFMNNQSDNISTSSIIGEALIADSIEHFGYNSGFIADKFRSNTDPESRALSPGNWSMSYNLFFDFTKAAYKSRLFTNVFAPEIEKIEDEFSNYKGWITNIASWGTNHAGGYPFAVYKMTPWQCMKQMEYRHPNTICKPMIYEDRMTLFYGVKEQMYFKRDLNKALQISASEQKDEEGQLGFDITEYYKKRRDRMEPVSNIHLVTSSTNLINNGLRLNAEYATKIKVNYCDNRDDAISGQPWDLKTFEAKADDNLYPFDIRSKELTMSGCLDRYAAFLYGTTELKKEAEKMYQGKILVLGNASMKAGDYVFIDDSEKRMHGLVLVRECYHHFDEKRGFMTEIVPGQYVEAANFLYSSLWLNLMCSCKIVTSKMRTILGSNYSSSDFNMVSDYLTIIRQAELALDEISDRKTDKSLASIYAATSLLSVFLINSLAKTLNIGDKNSLLKFVGVNISAGSWGFTKNFLRIFVNKTDQHLYNKVILPNLKSQAGKASLWLDKSRYDIKGILRQPKYIIASSKFVTDIKAARAAKAATVGGKISGATRSILGFGTKVALQAAKFTARALYTTLLAVAISNPLTLAIDAVVYMAIQYAFAKLEENTLTRQPLLYFPIIRHGKPYVGGMAGVVRNTWAASKIKEKDKTIKEIQKAAGILTGNHDVTNLASDRPFYISLLNGLAGENEKKTLPLYQSDSDGNKIIINDNKVTTPEKAEKREQTKLKSYLNDEENLKQHLIQKVNNSVVESLNYGL